MEPIIFISIVILLLAVGFIYFLVKILGKYNYYLLLVAILLSLYWWFGYREMSILEHHDSAYFYNSKKKNYSSKEEVSIGREFFVASYVCNRQEFLDTMKAIICSDKSYFDLKKYGITVYELPIFVGRISDGPISKIGLNKLVFISWNKKQPKELKLTWKYSVQKIELVCD